MAKARCNKTRALEREASLGESESESGSFTIFTFTKLYKREKSSE